jgi:hypothetical protein
MTVTIAEKTRSLIAETQILHQIERQSPDDYAAIRTAALRVKRAAQSVASAARTTQLRACEHVVNQHGRCEKCGWRIRVRGSQWRRIPQA